MSKKVEIRDIRDEEENNALRFTRYSDLNKGSGVSPVEMVAEPEANGKLRVSMTYERASEAEVEKQLKTHLGEVELRTRAPGGNRVIAEVRSTQADFAKLVAALATNVDLGRGSTSYAPLDAKVAEQIIEHHTQLTGLDAQAQGLITPTVERIEGARQRVMGLEKPTAYLKKCTINVPGSQVTEVGEDLFGSSRDRSFVITSLLVKGGAEHTAHALNRIMQKAGLDSELANDAKGVGHYVRVQSPASEAMQALSGHSDMIMPVVARGVEALSESLHPGQAQTNRDIESEPVVRGR